MEIFDPYLIRLIASKCEIKVEDNKTLKYISRHTTGDESMQQWLYTTYIN